MYQGRAQATSRIAASQGQLKFNVTERATTWPTRICLARVATSQTQRRVLWWSHPVELRLQACNALSSRSQVGASASARLRHQGRQPCNCLLTSALSSFSDHLEQADSCEQSTSLSSLPRCMTLISFSNRCHRGRVVVA